MKRNRKKEGAYLLNVGQIQISYQPNGPTRVTRFYFTGLAGRAVAAHNQHSRVNSHVISAEWATDVSIIPSTVTNRATNSAFLSIVTRMTLVLGIGRPPCAPNIKPQPHPSPSVWASSKHLCCCELHEGWGEKVCHHHIGIELIWKKEGRERSLGPKGEEPLRLGLGSCLVLAGLPAPHRAVGPSELLGEGTHRSF
jgi:hypothetical protein